MTEPLPLGQALRGVLREARTAPARPPEDAPVGDHWSFLWRSAFAEALTLRGLLFFGTCYALVVFASVVL